ncbi:MAG: hybrid sensor histidine kinase/response regulator, partial [Phormidesmis sp. CAN_BIN36]|nr:hybrid sensor histidine kinase/response regulator [Phormidesmis sp. CAN_BIN36]
PVIFMTALSAVADKVKGFNLGAVDYITKPFQQEEVLARVNLHLRLRDLSKKLEHLVEQRTIELTNTVSQLQQSQIQLIQGEKMSTLGQLVAGVAHEINNPVGFIDGNLLHIERYVQDLVAHLRMYQQHQPDNLIADHADTIELDFLLDDLPKVVTSMHQGTERIHDISMSLRTFSRSDTTHKVRFNIHEGIDSTLLILKHRLKANPDRAEIAIIKEYGDLPLIECFPGQLNQVFMNIIANAIDALEDSNQPQNSQENQITIRTFIDDDHPSVIIQIADNGMGIPEAAKPRIFEHLFTTKSVGKGTGLGLAIAHQIVVKKHEGTLEVDSYLGKGTTFKIILPIED